MAFHKERNCHPGLDSKNIVLRAGQFRIGAHITAEIDDIDFVELFGHHLAKTIKGAAVDKAAIGDHAQNTIAVQAIRGPAEKAGVHIVEFGLLRRRLFDVGFLDALIYALIGTVLVVVVFVLLIGVIGRIADNYADRALVLSFDARHVFIRCPAQQIVLVTRMEAERRHIIERIDKAQAGEFGELAGDGRIGGFDIQIGDIVGQDGHLVGVQFLLIFVGQLFRLATEMLDQFADKGAGAGGRIENLDIAVDQVLVKMLLGQPVRAFDHKTHDLVRGIDHAQPVGRLGIVDLVEIFVDDLQKGLLFAVVGDLGGISADGSVIGFQRLECITLDTTGEELRLQLIQGMGDIVLAVEIALIEHVGEDFLGQDMLDQHFEDIGLGDRGVDRRFGLRQKGRRSCRKRHIARISVHDPLTQSLKHRRQVKGKLFDGLAEIGNFLTFIAEEQRDQLTQMIDIGHRGAHDLTAILIKHRGVRILEDDIVARIALGELFANFIVQIVGGVLCFPIAKRDAQIVQYGAVRTDQRLLGRLKAILADEDQMVLLRLRLEQVLEGLTDHAFRKAT